MSGTKFGGVKAAKTNKERHGVNFYRHIGHIGGKNGHTGGFTGNPERARLAGAIGGRMSKRRSRSQIEADSLNQVGATSPAF